MLGSKRRRRMEKVFDMGRLGRLERSDGLDAMAWDQEMSGQRKVLAP